MSETAMDIVTRPYRRYFSFSGRASRAEFWLFILSALILFQIVTVAYNAAIDGGKRDWYKQIETNARVWLVSSDYKFDSHLFDWENFDFTEMKFDRSEWRNGSWREFDWRMFGWGNFGVSRDAAPSTLADGTAIDLSSCAALSAVRQNDENLLFYCFEDESQNELAALLVPKPLQYRFIAKIGMFIFLIIPFLSLISRRLHDCNRSAWWMLALFTGPTAFLLMLYNGFAKTKSETK